MKHFIKNFKHLPGKNCITTALRNILNHYNILMSEELIMGLSGGLGFYYHEFEGFPNPFIGGNSSALVQNFCQQMDLKYHELRKADPESAHKALLGKIISDIPVIVQVDLYYLDYYHSKFHFTGHRVIPVAVEDDIVFIADTGFRSIKKTSLTNFKIARSSDYAPGSPQNLQIFIEPPDRDLPVHKKLWEIISQNAENILLSKKGNGLSALQKFVDNIAKFTDLEYLYIQIEKAGTGGALGRRMYRDFLSEAILYRPHPRLVEAYELYSEIVEIYDTIINEIQSGKISEIHELLAGIYKREEKAVTILSGLPSHMD